MYVFGLKDAIFWLGNHWVGWFAGLVEREDESASEEEFEFSVHKVSLSLHEGEWTLGWGVGYMGEVDVELGEDVFVWDRVGVPWVQEVGE